VDLPLGESTIPIVVMAPIRPLLPFILLSMSLYAGTSQSEPDWSRFTGPFGDKVLVFEPDMDTAAMQAAIDGLNRQQAHAQFGSERYALLFKPGEYELDVTVDYYVEAAGLGMTPGDVRINGTVQSVTTTHNNNVTIMFWRAASNFEVRPPANEEPVYWAVSQAAPYRRMHIHGDLQLDRSGWASGGLLANSIVEGEARLTSGQQWLTRNSELGSWKGGNWNRTFVGTDRNPAHAMARRAQYGRHHHAGHPGKALPCREKGRHLLGLRPRLAAWNARGQLEGRTGGRQAYRA
jgi:hypothetical protein